MEGRRAKERWCRPPGLDLKGRKSCGWHIVALHIVALLLLLAALVPAAHADDTAEAWSLPEWVKRIRLSGNADVSYLAGEENSLAPDGRFAVDNARFFVDIDLGKKWSLYFEWDLLREAELKNEAGSLYLRRDELFGRRALNVKVGRFPIPFGEEYVRFHEERPTNPLISYSVGAPYHWDEGIEVFGSVGKLTYNFALQDGDNELNENTDSRLQAALKLKWQARDGFYLSFSAVDSGPVGEAALEWGGTHPHPFGADSDLPNYQHGTLVDDDPGSAASFTAFEGDLVFEPGRSGRFWLSYGVVDIASSGSSAFDRQLAYYVAEARVDLGPTYYLAARYSALGTDNADEGYLLEAMNGGDELGYNSKRVSALSVGGGARLGSGIILKAEYSFYRFDLVRGASAELTAATKGRNHFSVGLSARF